MGIDEKVQETAAGGHSTFIKPLKHTFIKKISKNKDGDSILGHLGPLWLLVGGHKAPVWKAPEEKACLISVKDVVGGVGVEEGEEGLLTPLLSSFKVGILLFSMLLLEGDSVAASPPPEPAR